MSASIDVFHTDDSGFFPYFIADYSKLSNTRNFIPAPSLHALSRLFWLARSYTMAANLTGTQTADDGTGDSSTETATLSAAATAFTSALPSGSPLPMPSLRTAGLGLGGVVIPADGIPMTVPGYATGSISATVNWNYSETDVGPPPVVITNSGSLTTSIKPPWFFAPLLSAGNTYYGSTNPFNGFVAYDSTAGIYYVKFMLYEGINFSVIPGIQSIDTPTIDPTVYQPSGVALSLTVGTEVFDTSGLKFYTSANNTSTGVTTTNTVTGSVALVFNDFWT